jgi:predicted transcriptional regulator
MTLREISALVSAKIVCGEDRQHEEVKFAFASDLLSDVLTIKSEGYLLITGLANLQCIRTAEMSDISFILIARNKSVSEEMKELAEENGILIMVSPFSLFKCSGILYSAGVKPVY